MPRIYLSTPHLGALEHQYVRQVFESNWISTVGPHIEAFEHEMEAYLGIPTVALASGTAANQLGLRLLGVGPGDLVFCQTLTFVASANPIRYLGAEPVFVDSERTSWNLDPQLLADALKLHAAKKRLPKAVVVVHLFGQCADMDAILEVCERYDVPVLEDAAEALGARYKNKPAGTMGHVASLSFNGNKIITTGGGGMLLSPRREWIEHARFWASQAREPGLAYQHCELGYNFRMSNVLAAIGRGQLAVLDDHVKRRRAIARRYAKAFADLDGIFPMPQAAYGLHTNWLSCFLVDGKAFGCTRDELIAQLAAAGVESRPVWKPMHRQPLFAGCEYYGGEVADDLSTRGICLPSSSSLKFEDQLFVINQVRGAASAKTIGQTSPYSPSHVLPAAVPSY